MPNAVAGRHGISVYACQMLLTSGWVIAMKTGVKTAGRPLWVTTTWHWDLFLKIFFLAKAKGKIYNQPGKQTSARLLLVGSAQGKAVLYGSAKQVEVMSQKVQTIGHFRSIPGITHKSDPNHKLCRRAGCSNPHGYAGVTFRSLKKRWVTVLVRDRH